MPYLHWETDRNQSRYTEVMDKTTGMYECKERECLKMQHKALRDKREQHCSTCGERSYACIPRVTHDDRDPYHVEKDVMLPQKAQRDPALLCTTSTPRKLDEVFEVKMRQEWKRKGNHTKTSRKAKDVNSRANGSSKSKTGNRPGEDLEAYPVSASEHSESSTGGEMISNDEKDSGDENDLFLRPKRMRQLLEIDEIKLSTRRLKPAHPLARYFIDAARLYEAMASFKDQKVLEAYLFPGLLEEETDAQVANEGDEEQRLARLHRLHPRRTLDQSYFWSLRSTRNRDKDQVVYRYTQAKFPHRLTNEVGRLAAFKAGGGSCLQQSCTDGDERATDWPKEWKECNHEQCKKWKSRDKWRWEGHTKYEDKFGCEQCREDIRQVARVVMVDQLWMWILDRNTILTCFPRRYGVPRKDPSGVHHSVRKRLKDQTNSSNHVRSVFDLALIILDECFDTFFDRQKKPDKRPQVMDIFSESIGDVVSSLVKIHAPSQLTLTLL